MHEWEVGPGENIAGWMDASIKASNRLLGVFTDEYTKALYSRAERWAGFWDDPDGRKGFFIPIEVETVSDWPPLIRALNRLSLVGLSESEAERKLLDFLKPRTPPNERPAFPGTGATHANGMPRSNSHPNVSEALPDERPIWPTAAARTPQGTARTTYRECNYDLLAEWYDLWYEGLWKKDEPFKTIQGIGEREYSDVFHKNKSEIQILDCACGTGNSYVAFHKAGYNTFGTDGSMEMLKKAKENCEEEKIEHENVILQRINWQDLNSYKEHLSKPTINNLQFDVIVNTSNSFCHIPPTDDYMTLALENFKALLRPDGLLVIDTKKYIKTAPIEDNLGSPRERVNYKELRFAGGEWKIRTEREDKRFLPELGGWIRFHTRLHYDVDRSFGQEIDRAMIVLTIFGGMLFPRTFVIPYYPLPANTLERYMTAAGFRTRIFPASEELDAEYRYDIVIGRKPL